MSATGSELPPRTLVRTGCTIVIHCTSRRSAPMSTSSSWHRWLAIARQRPPRLALRDAASRHSLRSGADRLSPLFRRDRHNLGALHDQRATRHDASQRLIARLLGHLRRLRRDGGARSYASHRQRRRPPRRPEPVLAIRRHKHLRVAMRTTATPGSRDAVDGHASRGHVSLAIRRDGVVEHRHCSATWGPTGLDNPASGDAVPARPGSPRVIYKPRSWLDTADRTPSSATAMVERGPSGQLLPPCSPASAACCRQVAKDHSVVS